MDRLTSLGMDYGPQEVRDLRDRLLGMRSSLAGKLDVDEMRSLAAAIELLGTMSERIWNSNERERYAKIAEEFVSQPAEDSTSTAYAIADAIRRS